MQLVPFTSEKYLRRSTCGDPFWQLVQVNYARSPVNMTIVEYLNESRKAVMSTYGAVGQ